MVYIEFFAIALLAQVAFACNSGSSMGSGNSNPNFTFNYWNTEPYFGDCGKSLYETKDLPDFKIINGFTAAPNSWPWMVSITISRSHICGGFLIHERYVLTAAHCLKGVDPKYVQAVVGLQTRTYDKNLAYQAEKIFVHELYKSDAYTAGFDMALIKLNKSVQLSDKVGLICLPSKSSINEINGKNVKVAGWGKTTSSFDGALATDLQEGIMTVGNDDVNCKKYNFDLSILYCLYDNSRSSDQTQICNGDSGGPFFYKKNNKWYAYGIVSFAIVEKSGTAVKCLTNSPSFFTKIPVFLDWIVEKIQGN